MRSAYTNPLDLNNFPAAEDHSSRDHGGYRKKRSGGTKDENEKVYECRFCSLKFCKSQALGGHMNRHRQERETETLNRARQLVFTNDNLVPPSHHLLGSGQPVPSGGYQTGDHAYRSAHDEYPAARLLSASHSSPILHPPPRPAPFMYASPPSHLFSPSQTYYNNNSQHIVNDPYLIGHVLSGTNMQHPNFSQGTNSFTCIGAPVAHGKRGAGGGVVDLSPLQRLDTM